MSSNTRTQWFETFTTKNSFKNKFHSLTKSKIQRIQTFRSVWVFRLFILERCKRHGIFKFQQRKKNTSFSNAPTVLPNKRFFFELSKVLTAFNVPKVWTFEHSTFQSSKKHVFFVFEFLDFSKVPNNMFWFLNFEFSKVKTKIRIQWSKFPIIWTFAKTRTKQRYFLNSRIFTGRMSSSTFPSMLQMLNIHKVTYDFLIIFSLFFSIFILRIFLRTLPISASMKVQTLFIFCLRPRVIWFFELICHEFQKFAHDRETESIPRVTNPWNILKVSLGKNSQHPRAFAGGMQFKHQVGVWCLYFVLSGAHGHCRLVGPNTQILWVVLLFVSRLCFASRITLKYLNALCVVSPCIWFLALDTALSSLSYSLQFLHCCTFNEDSNDRDLHQTWSHRGRPSVGSRPSWIWHSSETRPSLQNKRTVVVQSKHILDILHPVSMCVKDAMLSWF